jgi:hypothetical protein
VIWELYTPYKYSSFDIGKISSVYLNEDKTLIKRCFKPRGITVSGKQSTLSDDNIEQKWLTETKYLTKFQLMPWVPELIDINYQDRYTIQRYYGPDLLIAGFEDISDIEQQIVEIYKFFQQQNIYKLNGALSNMTKRDSKVIMFDFKYTKPRSPEIKDQAEYEIDQWLSKISPTIVAKLKDMI